MSIFKTDSTAYTFLLHAVSVSFITLPFKREPKRTV